MSQRYQRGSIRREQEVAAGTSHSKPPSSAQRFIFVTLRDQFVCEACIRLLGADQDLKWTRKDCAGKVVIEVPQAPIPLRVCLISTLI